MKQPAFEKISPAHVGRHAPPVVNFYRLAYRDKSQVMVRLTNAVAERTGWKPGDKIDVEFDRTGQRLRLSRRRNGAFTLGARSGDSNGAVQVRWTAMPGRPDLVASFGTENWKYRKNTDALTIEVEENMRMM